MIAISIAITTSALFISISLIYAVYTWAEVKEKERKLEEEIDMRHERWKSDIL